MRSPHLAAALRAAVRPGAGRGRPFAVSLAVLAVSVASCSFIGEDAQVPEPCALSDRTVVVERTTLVNAEPSVAFGVAEGHHAFVTMLADPEFNDGAGLNGGLVHASVYVIEDGESPQPAVWNDDGVYQSSPDFRVPRYNNPGESRFLDRPNGRYRVWSRSGPIVEVFTCAASVDPSGSSPTT